MSTPPAPRVPSVGLAGGVAIPQLGFGVFEVAPSETRAAVAQALAVGYRSIDTAAAYRNEEQVGAALADASIPREELFVTTKLWNGDQGHAEAHAAFAQSLARLGLAYVDLYLIHWPTPARDRYLDSWRAMIEIAASGQARAIGVSNFLPEHLERLVCETGVTPAVNQVELHPRLAQAELRAVHARMGVATEAWSPLERGRVLDHPVVQSLAGEHQRTPAQIVLRWHVQLGNIVIPRSVTPSRIAENFALFDFELDVREMAALDALEAAGRIGPDPASFERT